MNTPAGGSVGALTLPPRPQLFNICPWLGALLQLHRPVLRKIEQVRALLQTLLEARRPHPPSQGRVQSYLDALIQQGQVRPSPASPPKRPQVPPRRSGGGEGSLLVPHLLAGGLSEPQAPHL